IAAGIVGAAVWKTQSRPDDASWAVVEQYCFDCHNELDRAGDQAFDLMSPDSIAEHADTWEVAIRKLRAGLMPPAGAPRPEGEAVAQLVSWLTSELDSAAG